MIIPHNIQIYFLIIQLKSNPILKKKKFTETWNFGPMDCFWENMGSMSHQPIGFWRYKSWSLLLTVSFYFTGYHKDKHTIKLLLFF